MRDDGRFRINWSGGGSENYEGSISQRGKLIGVTRRGGTARFESIQRFQCFGQDETDRSTNFARCFPNAGNRTIPLDAVRLETDLCGRASAIAAGLS